MRILSKFVAVFTAAAVFLMPVYAAEPNAAELSALSDYIAAKTEGEPYVIRLALAATLLNRLKDPRYPDTVSGILAREGYRAVGRSAEYESARCALRAVLEGLDVTGGATLWAKGKSPGFTPTLEIEGWCFGE